MTRFGARISPDRAGAGAHAARTITVRSQNRGRDSRTAGASESRCIHVIHSSAIANERARSRGRTVSLSPQFPQGELRPDSIEGKPQALRDDEPDLQLDLVPGPSIPA